MDRGRRRRGGRAVRVNDEGESGRPFNVVIDGRVLTWEELGQALEPYEGWNFRLVIEDRVEEARSDADVVDITQASSSHDPTPPK